MPVSAIGALNTFDLRAIPYATSYPVQPVSEAEGTRPKHTPNYPSIEGSSTLGKSLDLLG